MEGEERVREAFVVRRKMGLVTGRALAIGNFVTILISVWGPLPFVQIKLIIIYIKLFFLNEQMKIIQ